jgi:DNA-binding FadR family transcriptional regulator
MVLPAASTSVAGDRSSAGGRKSGFPSGSGVLHQATQQAIRHYSVANRLRPNDPLPPEGELAEQFGVSRTSVREAVKALESLGVLEARARVGIFVAAFSLDRVLDNLAYSLLVDRDSVEELLDVRTHLEASFSGAVVASATPSQLRVLRSVVDRMGARAARGEAFPEEDRFFHRTLYEPLQNQLILKLVDVFWTVFRRLRDDALVEEDPDPVRAWEDHRRIVEALERRDVEGAQTALIEHFGNVKERIRNARLRARAETAHTVEPGEPPAAR